LRGVDEPTPLWVGKKGGNSGFATGVCMRRDKAGFKNFWSYVNIRFSESSEKILFVLYIRSKELFQNSLSIYLKLGYNF